jgi:hypothetical protein
MDFPAMFDETGASISAAVSIAMCELLEGTGDFNYRLTWLGRP